MIVIANDDANARIIAETLLRLRGLPVWCAADAASLCNLLQLHDVSVVVLDADLPGLDALDVFRQSPHRAGRQLTAAPRLVLVTNQDEVDSRSLVLQLGADVVLRRPVPPREFVETVERLVRATREAA